MDSYANSRLVEHHRISKLGEPNLHGKRYPSGWNVDPDGGMDHRLEVITALAKQGLLSPYQFAKLMDSHKLSAVRPGDHSMPGVQVIQLLDIAKTMAASGNISKEVALPILKIQLDHGDNEIQNGIWQRYFDLLSKFNLGQAAADEILSHQTQKSVQFLEKFLELQKPSKSAIADYLWTGYKTLPAIRRLKRDHAGQPEILAAVRELEERHSNPYDLVIRNALKSFVAKCHFQRAP